MSKTYVGARAQSMDIGAEVPNITRINLVVDSDHMYTAGDDTGRTMEVECPWGTQAMADSILAGVSGVKYRPYTAERALLDPAFEIGDAVTVGGLYSVIASADCTYDAAGLVTIEAPDLDELDDEYPSEQTQDNSIKRQLAYTRSLITKTAKEIGLLVEGIDGQLTELSVSIDGISGEVQGLDDRYAALLLNVDGLSAEVQGLEWEYASLALTVEGFTVTGPSGTTLIKGSSIDTSTLNVENINIDLTGAIKWTDLSEAVRDEIDEAYMLADSAADDADSALTKVQAVTYTYGGKTYIDEDCIMAGTVIAGHLMGGTVKLLDSDGYTQGYLTITDADTADYAVEIESEGAMRLLASGTYAALFMQAGSAAYLSIQTIGSNGYHVVSNRSIVPASDGANYVGTSYRTWGGIYTETDPVVTSDKKQKKNIKYGMDEMDGFFDGLLPGSFQLVKGTSGRRHSGFVAQDVLENLKKHNISTTDFAGYVEDVDEDGNPTYGLRYGEFIALLVDQVQKLKARVATLEGKKHEV